ncbi:MAG: 23S rRNA (uracil1939-C5)-methyltransferase [Planctomycetota bacterium]|jgi:23S rRNA (uracil1939-C5)-methyltransferase
MARRRRKKKKSYAADCLATVVERGDVMLEAPCPVAATCGGCSWQTMAYESQLGFKKQFIADSFTNQGFEGLSIPDPEFPTQKYGYRNHMEFSFAARRWLTDEEIATGAEFDRSFALGLHAPGGFGRVLDFDTCLLQNDKMNTVFQACRQFTQSHELPAYDHSSHEGFWRFLILRQAKATDDILVHIVTRIRDESVMAAFCDHVQAAEPSVVTITNGVTESVADTSQGATVFCDFGNGTIVEEINGLQFEVSSTSFFQPNSETAGMIFRQVAELAGDVRGKNVVDLFCGTGTLALVMAQLGAKVIGLEVVPEAIECAKRNAELNNLPDVQFEVCDLMKGLPESIETVDVVITDPPRAGMHKKTIKQLIDLAPQRIVSVGCNPKTQAENIRELCDRGGYRIEAMTAVDQFPQTPHVENVALLIKQ